jgi:hypothetical protein
MNWIDVARSMDPTLVALVVMTVLVVATVVSWHRNKAGFDLTQVITDSTTGRVAVEKVGYMTALAISTWGFVALILHDKMTEAYAGLYMATFAAARFGSQWLATKKDIATAPGPTP